MPSLSVIDRTLTWTRGFLEANAPQSMTRAVALMCGITGCVCALAAALISKRPHLTAADAQVVHELSLVTASVIGGGAVALLTRSKQAVDDKPSKEADV